MSFSPILFFSVSFIFTWILFQLIGKNYALDHPNLRKRHSSSVPQIGGLVFGPLLLLIAWWLGLAPGWYLISGLVSVLLGAADDVVDACDIKALPARHRQSISAESAIRS